MGDTRNNVLVTAALALTLVFTILLFASTSPWLLAGVPPVLAGTAAVIRAIQGGTRPDEEPKRTDGTPKEVETENTTGDDTSS
ncbi:hypothetical protein ACIOD2_37675 [Amycolatopsis sp. NPDC088138]|uniref:hypothetical protein n=1 Tax=Amycolatopsis sp. NPDC088138 TaxID=3363938 RepID=UPI0038005971